MTSDASARSCFQRNKPKQPSLHPVANDRDDVSFTICSVCFNEILLHYIFRIVPASVTQDLYDTKDP